MYMYMYMYMYMHVQVYVSSSVMSVCIREHLTCNAFTHTWDLDRVSYRGGGALGSPPPPPQNSQCCYCNYTYYL